MSEVSKTDSLPPSTTWRPFQFRLWQLLTAMAIVAAALGLFWWVRQAVRHQAQQRERFICLNNLGQIGMALRLYHDEYGSFPPAYVCDTSGKPMHSWRALILPYVQDGTTRSYDLTEPWDGPHNQSLSSQRPIIFTCPSDTQSDPSTTSYVAVVGEATIWPGSRAIRSDEIGDGVRHTVLLVEIGNSDIHWLEPRDLPLEELESWLDPGHRPGALQTHVEGGYVLHADGEVYYLPRAESLAELRATLTRNGKEKGPVFDNSAAR